MPYTEPNMPGKSFNMMTIGIALGGGEILMLQLKVILPEMEVLKFLYEDLGTNVQELVEAFANFKGYKSVITKTYFMEEIPRHKMLGDMRSGIYYLEKGTWYSVDHSKVSPLMYMVNTDIEEYIQTMGYIEIENPETLIVGDIVWQWEYGQEIGRVVREMGSGEQESTQTFKVKQLFQNNIFIGDKNSHDYVRYPTVSRRKNTTRIFRKEDDSIDVGEQ